jgi:hypothetical protein
MWLAIIALSLITMGIFGFVLRPWLTNRRRALGVMSQQWLSGHNAESRH